MNTRQFFKLASAGILCLLLAAVLLACSRPAEKSLVIYSYDSFTSEWGPGPAIIAEFEAQTGIKVSLLGIGDAGQTLARLIEQKNRPEADLIIGIDNHLLPKALAAEVLEPYRPALADTVPARLVLDKAWHLTPFDYGTFAIIWDSHKLANPPRSLEDLTRAEFARSLILMDPRTSSPGLGFLAWTHKVYGDRLADYWKRLAPSILAMTPGWSTGYGLFTKGEAPLVISYTTSAAYHAEYETAGRYLALEFPEGHPIQIEGIGLVKGSKNKINAQRFLDFVLSEGFQKHIPLTNWMYPISQTLPLPESFQYAPLPATTYMVDALELVDLDRVALDALQSRP